MSYVAALIKSPGESKVRATAALGSVNQTGGCPGCRYCDGPLLDILEELPESKLVAEIRNQILTRHPSAKPAAPT